MVAAIDVSWTAFEPSGSASQISVGPERSESKATRRPSGENWGDMSGLVEAMAALGGEDAGAPGAEVEMRQMLMMSVLRTYSSRDGLPGCGRETTGMIPFSPTK